MTLSRFLRDGTTEAHRQAERSAFVEMFVHGSLDRDTYTRHLLALHGVYEALEAGLVRWRDDRRVGRFHLPELWRREALAADLEFLIGPAWRRWPAVPAARRYVEQLEALSGESPLRLVSHAYVRYLGDLSGGRVLRRLAARILGLEDDGLRFYEFPLVDDAAELKDRFRRRLDELELAAGEAQALLDEARTAFDLNAAIFDQLVETSHPQSW